MQTIAASTIFDDAYQMIGWDPDDLEPRQQAMARQSISLALQEIWERWWWEQLMQTEQVQLAGDWIPSWIYETGHPVYFAPTDAYYVALWAAGPPALQPGEAYADYGYNTGTPDDATPVTAITENLYGWAKLKPCAATPPLWNNLLTPALGDQCVWKGNIFQWIVPQGALPNNEPDATLTNTTPTNPGWMVVPAWWPQVPFTLQTPDTVHGGYSSSDVGPFGELLAVTQLDPRSTANHGLFHTREADDASGRVVLNLTQARPWVAARRPTPILTADPFDSTAVYTATPAQQLVFDS